ncbi:hypothetical protein HD806DRAFT_534245 [Xylariaceae sp. AK1471]|nr:hypothetical protein HD806DRAFT_534245 [Xylariaceae sp. AK1471]
MSRTSSQFTGMPQYNNQTKSLATTEPIVVVETSNFHEVLRHFTMRGNFKDEKRTRLSILCMICLAKNLAIINPGFDKSVNCSTHEFYTVLRCGHAFGFTCLNKWFVSQSLENLKCPICRAAVNCKREHLVPLKIRGGTEDMELQRREIKKIRAMLCNPTCELCPIPESGASPESTSSSETPRMPSHQPNPPSQLRFSERPPIPPRSSSLRHSQNRSNIERAIRDLHVLPVRRGVETWLTQTQTPNSPQPPPAATPPSSGNTNDDPILWGHLRFLNESLEAPANSNNVPTPPPTPPPEPDDHGSRTDGSLLSSPTTSASATSSTRDDEGSVLASGAQGQQYDPSGGLSVPENYQVLVDMMSAYEDSGNPDHPLGRVLRRKSSLWQLR